MEAKLKAQELYSKYCSFASFWMDQNDAKKCALICVEEIQNLCWGNNQVGINYWNEVKHEIEKL
jgi:hypothetical protein